MNKVSSREHVVEDMQDRSRSASEHREPLSLKPGSQGISSKPKKEVRKKKSIEIKQAKDGTPVSLAAVHAVASQAVTPATAPQHPARAAARSQPDVSQFTAVQTQEQKKRKPSELKVALNVPGNISGADRLKKRAKKQSQLLNTSRMSERSKTLMDTIKARDRTSKSKVKKVTKGDKVKVTTEDPPVRKIELHKAQEASAINSPRSRPVANMPRESRLSDYTET